MVCKVVAFQFKFAGLRRFFSALLGFLRFYTARVKKEQQRRKRPLIKGPKEFRNIREEKAEEEVIIAQGLLRIEVH